MVLMRVEGGAAMLTVHTVRQMCVCKLDAYAREPSLLGAQIIPLLCLPRLQSSVWAGWQGAYVC